MKCGKSHPKHIIGLVGGAAVAWPLALNLSILTERSSRSSGGKDKARVRMGPQHLLNRPGEPEEIAAGAAYLASDDAAFVTATDLLIDGGYVAFKGKLGPNGLPTLA